MNLLNLVWITSLLRQDNLLINVDMYMKCCYHLLDFFKAV